MLGEEYLESLSRLKKQRDHLLESVRSELDSHDLDWFQGKFGPSGRALEEIAATQQEAWQKEAKRLSEGVFVWHQAGLGRRDLLADFDYWERIPIFELDEITLLSVGVEPHQAFKERLDPDKKSNRNKTSADDFIRRRYELVKRTFSPYERRASTYAKELFAWATSVNLDAHPGFLRMLDRIAQRVSGEAPQSNEISKDDGKDADKSPEGREIASMSKLLTAIAITEYGYDPQDRRSPIPREIQELADLLGLSVSQDTIRKYLKTGAKYLPKDWKPDS